MAFVGAFASPVCLAAAQGPALPTDPRPAPSTSPSSEATRLLATNLARLAAASAPKAFSLRPTGPFVPWSSSAQGLRDSIIVSVTRTALGTRYVTGGQSFERGFDCSGLVRYVMTALKVPVPRTVAQQADAGVALGRDPSRLRPGDLLTFGRNARGASHVGIYVGNGRYIHASSVAGRVIESDIDRPMSPRVKSWRGSRRVLSGVAPDSATREDG